MLQLQMKMLAPPILSQHSQQRLKKQLQLIMLHQMAQQLLAQIIQQQQAQLHLHLGVTTQNIPVAVLADAKDEVNETVTVTLSNPSEVTLNDAIGVLTITDDDNEPNISIADMTTPNETACWTFCNS